jgi:predicted ATPase/serine/threonine protein kinase
MRQCRTCSRLFEDHLDRCPDDGTTLSAPDALLGAVIDGKYRIDGLIGAGGMGAVYRATQIALARPTALKVVRGDYLADDMIGARFKREALAVARLKHRHIVTIYDFGISSEVGAYIAMEHLEGRTLAEAIRTAGSLQLDFVLEIAAQVCSAVHAAHEAGVIHRDLKPQNIFLERFPDGERTKVLDFGVAKLETGSGESASMTQTGAVLGTPLYMSPEQCEGLTLDARSDIYSLGCVVYEMLTGRPPFTGPSLHAILLSHFRDQPDPPSRYVDGIPSVVDLAVLNALAKSPDDRFQTAGDFAKALAGGITDPRFRTGPISATTERPVSTPTNLPPQITTYIGREQDTDRVANLIDTARLVTLAGPAGIGKTRLALQAASRLLRKFPDGVWVVELEAVLDGALASTLLATTLGVRDEGTKPLLTSLVDAVGGRRILIVFDNCEHVVDACAELAQTLLRICPRLSILATSRETLRVEGEAVLRIPPLPVPDPEDEASVDLFLRCDAVKLLVDRIRLRNASFEVSPQSVPLLGKLCRQLEGIPLAIELAAARAHVLSIEQIVARLDDRFRLLASSSRMSLARQRTLLAAIDWSYDLLTTEEQVLFRRLAVFSGGWSLEAAETVCAFGDLDVLDVLDCLERLVDKSLVLVVERKDDVRYRMLETLRDYGSGKLRDADEGEAIRRKQLSWGMTLAESTQTEANTAEADEPLDWLDREHDNLRAILLWSVGENHAIEEGLRLCTLLANFWCVRGYAGEGNRWIETAISGTSDIPSTALAAAHLAASRLSYYLAEIEPMRRHCERSLEIARTVSDERLAEQALNRLALALILLCEFEKAHTCLAECLALHERRGDVLAMAEAWDRLGMLAISEGQYDDARKSYESAVRTFRELGATRQLSTCLLNLGEALFYLGRLDEAEEQLEESLHVSRDLGFRAATAFALFVFGNVLIERRDFIRARRMLVEAVDIAAAIGEVRCVAHTLEAFARASVEMQQYERALQLLGAASKLREANHAFLAPAERDYLEGYWQRARDRLGSTVADSILAEGRELTQQRAIVVARAWEIPSTDTTVIVSLRKPNSRDPLNT